MIPRYDGLVPAIRGPASSSNKAVASERAATPTTVERFTIRPTLSSSAAYTEAATLPKSAAALKSGEGERRLYTFLPSADGEAPPRELRVAASFFGDTPDNNVTAAAAAGRTGDASVYEDGDGEGDGDDAEVEDAMTNDSLAQRRGGRGRPRRRRGAEPMRLQYDGIADTDATTPASANTLKMASTPATAFKGLACVLLEMPTTWREPRRGEAKGGAAAADTPGGARYIAPTALSRPVLQLWAERKEASDASSNVDESGGTRAGTSISSKWISTEPLRISTKDWKTMDKVDADMHKPTNWSDDDGGDDDAKTVETEATARERKRAKKEMSSVAVRSFLESSKAALQQQFSRPEDSGPPSSAEAKAQRQLEPLSLRVTSATLTSTATTEKVVSMPPPSPSPSAPSSAPSSEKGRTMNLGPQTRASALAVVNAGKEQAAARRLELSAAPVHVAPPPKNTTPTLSSLAAEVLGEVQQKERRTAAPLMELQKRILKQLPDFAIMNQKIKSPETKKEAVEWFQTCQRELRLWLQGQGHAIASDSTVTFAA